MNLFVDISILLIILLLLYRIFCFGGMPAFLGQKASGVLLKRNDRYDSYTPDKKDIILIGVQALLWRLLLYLISFMMLKLISMGDQSFLEWWLKYDATNYVGIAKGGYDEIKIDGVYNMGDGVMSTLVFFPLYPFFIRIVNFVVRNVELSALVTSTICYVVGCIYLYKAVAIRYGKQIAEKAVILITVFSHAFFFGAMTPESTFLLTCSACMYYTYKKNWWMAGVFGILSAASRIQGVLLIVFMGIQWFEDGKIITLLRTKDWKTFGKEMIRVIPILSVLAGLGIYIYLNYLYTGDPFYFMKLQLNVWGHKFVDIGEAMKIIWEYFSGPAIGIEEKMSVWIPQLALFIFTIVMILRSFSMHDNSLSAFLLAYLVISYSTDYLISGARYMSVALPLFMFVAELCDKKTYLFRWCVGAGLVLQMMYMYCHLSGWHLVT